jgi:hypothetical protein
MIAYDLNRPLKTINYDEQPKVSAFIGFLRQFGFEEGNKYIVRIVNNTADLELEIDVKKLELLTRKRVGIRIEKLEPNVKSSYLEVDDDPR